MSISFSLFIEINSNNISKVCTPVDELTAPPNVPTIKDTVPTAYTSKPNVTNGYLPPSQSISTAYYDRSPFNATVSQGPPSSSYSSNSNSNITPYGTYMISYNISDISKIDEYQIYDMIYLYYYLSLYYFTPDFLSSNFFKDGSKESLVNMLTNYCNSSGNMSSGLCNSTSGIGSGFPYQTLITQSPCTNPYSNCYNGWDDFCFQSGNYDSPECLNYYSNSYKNNQLNANIKNGLLNICSSIYNSNTTPPENFWEVCSCFLPQEVYTNFLAENNVTGISQGAQQCWYYPCISASVQPEATATCPNSTVVSCIQKQYLTLQDTGGNITDNTIKTQQAINNCQAATTTGKSNTPVVPTPPHIPTSPPQPGITSPPQSGTKNK